jgi:hypothetical protein
MVSSKRHWLYALGYLLLLLLLLTLVVAAELGDHRFLIGSGGGQSSQGNLVLKSAFGQPIVGGSSNGIKLCSGFHSGDCSTVPKVFLPVISRAGG